MSDRNSDLDADKATPAATGKEERKEAPKWAPPAALAAAAFVVGLSGSAIGLTKTVVDWVRPPPPPKMNQEYLMIDASADEMTPDGDIKETLKGVTEQIPGVHVVMPEWLKTIEADKARLRTFFCEHNEVVLTGDFSSATDPARTKLVSACEEAATEKVLIGTYGLRSFHKDPITDLQVDVAVLSNPDGAVEALDGFLPGQISVKSNCFVSSLSEQCTATRTRTKTLDGLPEIGPGEMVLIPIFLIVQFQWGEASIEAAGGSGMAYDGYAAAPFWFPTQVRSGKRIVIQFARPMNETPSLKKGGYEARG